ncbi:MAG: bifunctional (p)ppGpp synthetase/guanosine-3',5'-bis(diphosphate) 3'-pyrophosphohydrolase [Dehalococcoidia bacterium]|nr:MAG: bifunctional (p)ppGpp synthetase/guanosine-3',5'-bis(diphosphate) 3'-pyrophosphohydrolase [Dehalococcoidia bacterium]
MTKSAVDDTHLLKKAGEYLPPDKVALVARAYEFAAKAHESQKRDSGEPFITHPLAVAMLLAELQLDANSLAAALLHDVPEDVGLPLAKIEADFSPEIAKLVDGTTKFAKLTRASESSASEAHLQNLRKMLVAMAEDLRVVFIKLADRLHNLRTLEFLPPNRQQAIAQETMEIYAPLAHRLGIWEFKWQLEDLAFRYLEPEKYRRLARMLADRRARRETFITQVIEFLKGEFAKNGLEAEISGRPKHLYSIHQKMERYQAQGKYFDDIHDLLALRVLVASVADCYTAVGIIHSLWHPIPGEFDDYIANPKPNGYQSLHTSVMYQGTTPLEVQVRTREMHNFSEYGIAAHWRYKEGGGKDAHFEEKLGWLRQLVEWHREMSLAEDFLESVKTDILIDQVFVFTPRGEIKDLPKGATPLDFAYRIHTELGHRCIGAKVNGRLVPLTSQLNNGDVVDIIRSKTDRGPSRDWLSTNLGYAKTSHAREKIRQWFKKQQREENIERGRSILERELRRLGIKLNERQALAKMFNYDNLDDFLMTLGYGGISTRQIAQKLMTEQAAPEAPPTATPTKAPASPVMVLGSSDLLTHLAQCCHPVPGDKIIGYVTRSRGVTVHREDCYNVINEEERERLVPVEWARGDALYPMRIQVDAWDRVGLVRDITTIVAEEKVNITAMSLNNHDDGTISTVLTLETKGLPQLARLMAKIEGARGVISITRLGEETGKSK